jgi:hypothetical protein
MISRIPSDIEIAQAAKLRPIRDVASAVRMRVKKEGKFEGLF